MSDGWNLSWTLQDESVDGSEECRTKMFTHASYVYLYINGQRDITNLDSDVTRMTPESSNHIL
jgi:hypothetical protein